MPTINRYWYRDINWLHTALILGVFALIAACVLVFLVKDDQSLSENPEAKQSENSTVTYQQPLEEHVMGPLGVESTSEVSFSESSLPLPEGEDSSEEAQGQEQVDEGFTGGGINQPGQMVYEIYRFDNTVQVQIAAINEFYISGISASDIPEFGIAALKALEMNAVPEIVTSSGIYKGDSDQTGAYLITNNGANGMNYLTMYLKDEDRVAVITGLISEDEFPNFLKSLRLLAQ
jgi:hypothetical protein